VGISFQAVRRTKGLLETPMPLRKSTKSNSTFIPATSRAESAYCLTRNNSFNEMPTFYRVAHCTASGSGSRRSLRNSLFQGLFLFASIVSRRDRDSLSFSIILAFQSSSWAIFTLCASSVFRLQTPFITPCSITHIAVSLPRPNHSSFLMAYACPTSVIGPCL